MPLIPFARKIQKFIQRGTAANRPAVTDVLAGSLYYSTDTGVLERNSGAAWESMSASAAVAGADTQVIFNDTGAYAGDAGLVYNKTTDALTLAGQLIISGASAGQIVFPGTQNASSNVNTLDDYEEGTWTPSIGGTGGQSGQAYSTQAGYYVKIGKFVFVSGRVTLSTLGTITTAAQIQGLPFTVENISSGAAGAQGIVWGSMTTSFVFVAGNPVINTTTINLLGATAAATGLTALVQGDLSATSDFRFNFSYRATA